MKRYWLFAGVEFHPSGGMEDFVAASDNLDELKARVLPACDEEAERPAPPSPWLSVALQRAAARTSATLIRPGGSAANPSESGLCPGGTPDHLHWAHILDAEEGRIVAQAGRTGKWGEPSAEWVLPEAGSIFAGANFFRACIGDSHVPGTAIGKHSGTHPETVRAVYGEARERYPEAADVIAALVFEVEIQRQRSERMAKALAAGGTAGEGTP